MVVADNGVFFVLGHAREQVLARGGITPGLTDYFAVTIPKSLQKYYFDNAKIDGGFDVVGRYVSNTKYKTVAGQEKAAPVFEAVYFVIW